MCRFARDGRHLADLVSEAAAVCRAADDALPKPTRPGRPDTFRQWQIASLIFVAVAHRCKSKSSQYRFLVQHREQLRPLLRDVLSLQRLPSRATYMRRYKRADAAFRQAIKVGGRRALQEHAADARNVAMDKSLIAARGPRPPRARERPKAGVDVDAAFGKSAHDGWVWGYSYEVAVSAGKSGVVMPLLASADRANVSEHRSGIAKVPDLPRSTRNVLTDGGYDDNNFGESVEYTLRGQRTGRRLLCPMQRRGGKPCVGQTVRKGRRERLRRHRAARHRFMQGARGKRLYALRKQTVEPFNQWFKHLFELEDRVWHRGLDNNRTMLLAAMFCYQTLQRYNYACGRRDGQVNWILDAL
jgi:hypothetical protein